MVGPGIIHRNWGSESGVGRSGIYEIADAIGKGGMGKTFVKTKIKQDLDLTKGMALYIINGRKYRMGGPGTIAIEISEGRTRNTYRTVDSDGPINFEPSDQRGIDQRWGDQSEVLPLGEQIGRSEEGVRSGNRREGCD